MRDTVMVIGSGLMGPGIAAVSALAGNKTVLAGRSLATAEKGVQRAHENITELYNNQLADQQAKENAYQLIFASDDLDASADNAFVVIEAVPEDLALKQQLFKRLDALLPADIPILSNTSGLRITDIAKLAEHPERILTAHFWFPAHLVPLVEVVIGDRSSKEMAVEIKELLKKWGKQPVIVKKDLPGQLANRILQAIIREAVNIVEIGLAEPEDVDMAMKAGPGIRLPVWGPIEHIEAVGLDLCKNVQRTVLPDISNAQAPSSLFENHVANGNLGYKTGKGFYDWSVKDMGKDMYAIPITAF